MTSVQQGRLFKLVAVGTLMLAIMVAGLMGNQNSRTLAHEDEAHQTFMIQAGAFGLGNVELVAFAPNSLKVHRGDTVMWHFNSFHNVHFGEDTAASLIIAPEANGQPMPQLNPAVVFPTVQTGATYTGGEANTGLPVDPSAPLTFSMVIDLPPGNYLYYCDVHPGMVGAIEVVADDVEIPSASEVVATAADDISMQVTPPTLTIEPRDLQGAAMASDGKLAISAGSGEYGRTSIQAFSSPLAVIHVGESVTWTVPADSIEPHTITSSNFGGQEFIPMPQPNGPPVIALGEVFIPGAKTEISASDSFNSGFLEPGQSYSLTFSEPGVHAYVCRLHDGMSGVVVVEPAM